MCSMMESDPCTHEKDFVHLCEEFDYQLERNVALIEICHFLFSVNKPQIPATQFD